MMFFKIFFTQQKWIFQSSFDWQDIYGCFWTIVQHKLLPEISVHLYYLLTYMSWLYSAKYKKYDLLLCSRD